jgi:hypothetical protein
MTETFIVNVGIHVSMNERIVDVQLHGPVDEQQLSRDRMKYARPACVFTVCTYRTRPQVLQSKCPSYFD